MAIMLQRLGLNRGVSVLEIGAGTGYNAALMATLVGAQQAVVTVDIQADVVAQTRRRLKAAGFPDVRLVQGDGFDGVPQHAPYDRIVATVGCPDISPRWADQLSSDGFMLIPLEHGGMAPQTRVWVEGDELVGRPLGWSGFMTMSGQLQREGPNQVRTVPPEALAGATAAPEWVPLTDAVRISALMQYLVTVDDRAGVGNGFGLFDGDSYLAFGNGQMLRGGAVDLLPDFRAIYDRWMGLGAPGFGRLKLTFRPTDREGSAPDHTICARQRKVHTQFISVVTSEQARGMHTKQTPTHYPDWSGATEGRPV